MSEADLKRRHADHTINGHADRVADAALVKLAARFSMIALIPLLGWIGYKFDGRLEAVEKLALSHANIIAGFSVLATERGDRMRDLDSRLTWVERQEFGPR